MTLVDQKVRDDAANVLDRTIFMEAGAGTGKTTMLIRRLVGLIATKTATMEQIAAITFTEAAAAELRDRLLEALETFDPTGANETVRDALHAIDGAAITTLHGFARRLLSEHPFAAGLPPVFEVADASGSRVAFDERWDELVNQLLTDPAYEEVVVRALSCGLKWPQLQKAARQCEENWDRLSLLHTGTAPPPIDSTTVRAHLELALSLSHHCVDGDDKLLQHLAKRISPALDSVRDAVEPIDVLQMLVGLPKLTSSLGRAAKWTSIGGVNIKNEVCDALASAQDERDLMIGATVQWTMVELFGLVVADTLAAATSRRASGRLMFHDLLVLARRLVRDDAEARRQLHQHYTHILIDEFQDTDPIQVELAMYLAAGNAADVDQHWSGFPVEPGRLFFVGDPKQSIYRFRRADIEVFLTTRDKVVGQGEHLVTNFRSRPEIVEWVNVMFGRLFGAGQGTMQPEYHALMASDDRGTANPRRLKPVILLGQEPLEQVNAEGVRRRQADAVAATIATMHAEGWRVRHGDGAPSPMCFSDVAILVTSRTGMETLEKALRAAGVPFRLESSSLVYQSQDVRTLLSILRAIDDPTDAVSVVAALRSPAFGCGDDDLLRHAASGGGWDPRAPVGSGVVADGLAALGDYHGNRWWGGVSEFIGRVVADRRLLELALAEDGPRESWRRVRFVLDQARLFEESSGGDLRAFLSWVGHQQDEDARVTEIILPETDDDAVRISTIHSAKGLEFPVTVLLGFERGVSNERPALLFGPQPELYLNRDFKSAGYEALLTVEKEMDLCERIRLLYVAATRACDVLVVSLHRKADKSDILAGRLAELCVQFPEFSSDGTELAATPQRVVAPEVIPFSRDEESRDEFAARRDRLLDHAARPRVVPATAVVRLGRHDDSAADGPEVQQDADEGPVQRRGRAGTSVGRAVHGVLQLVDLATGEGLDALAGSQATTEGVPGRESDVRALSRVALASDLVRRAVDSGRYWREVYLGVPIGERVLEGFIDLLFETPEGLWIVDYKTDQLRDEDDAAEVAKRYRLQGAAYARAAQKILGREVAGCSFLFLRPMRAVEVELRDLPAAMMEVDALLAQ